MKSTQKIKAPTLEGTFGRLELIEDNLPSPEQLVFKPTPIKITINLDEETLQYFKNKAHKLGGSYQRMIRNLLDLYVKQAKNKENQSQLTQ